MNLLHFKPDKARQVINNLNFCVMTTPDASDSTWSCLSAADITPSDLVTTLLADGGDAADWSALTFPSALSSIDFLASSDYCVQSLGAFSTDLTTFLSYCAGVSSCQYEAYSARYDGLALGHYLDLTMVATALGPTSGGSDTTYYIAVCDGDTLNCWGWSLYADYT